MVKADAAIMACFISLSMFASSALPAFAVAVSQSQANSGYVVPIVGSAKKICQLVGDFDRERNEPTLSQTGKNFGVLGTDLGISFEYHGRLMFLFGDTVGRPGALDSFAYTTDPDPEKCLRLVFYLDKDSKFLPPRVPGISQGAFEVPVEGVSVRDQLYVFFTTDHSESKVMGRSIVARWNEASGVFNYLYDFSKNKFINVSVEIVDNSKMEGLPDKDGEGLLIWGSGDYRKSDPYLAYISADSIENKAGIRYFTGTQDGQPKWSIKETEAIPLFNDPCIGELSVTWNAVLERWMMTYSGVSLRSASLPWGPWSENQILFNPWRDNGYGHFIHISWQYNKSDNVYDPGRENEWGGPYGPYVISQFTRGEDGKSTVYFTLSTWNPYTVVLMKAELQLVTGSVSTTQSSSTQTTSSTIAIPKSSLPTWTLILVAVVIGGTLTIAAIAFFRRK